MANLKKAIAGVLDANSKLKKANLRDAIGKNMTSEEKASFDVVAPMKQKTQQTAGENAIDANTAKAKRDLRVDDTDELITKIKSAGKKKGGTRVRSNFD